MTLSIRHYFHTVVAAVLMAAVVSPAVTTSVMAHGDHPKAPKRASQCGKPIQQTDRIARHTAGFAVVRFDLEQSVSEEEKVGAGIGMNYFLRWKLGGAAAVCAQYITGGYGHFERSYSDEAAAMMLGILQFGEQQPDLKLPEWMIAYLNFKYDLATVGSTSMMLEMLGLPDHFINRIRGALFEQLAQPVFEAVTGITAYVPKSFDVENRLVREAIEARKYAGQGYAVMQRNWMARTPKPAEDVEPRIAQGPSPDRKSREPTADQEPQTGGASMPEPASSEYGVGNEPIASAPRSKPQPEPEGFSTKTIRLIGPGTVALAPADWVSMNPYYWKVLDSKTGEEIGRSGEANLRVKAGEYRIVWRQTRFKHDDVPLPEVVRVSPGETEMVAIDTGLQIVVPDAVQAPWKWWLRREGEEDPLASFTETLEPQVVPAGRYRLVWYQHRFDSRPVELETVVVWPNRLNRVAADNGFQIREAAWVEAEAPYGVWLVSEDGAELGPWRTFETHLAPPARYRVRYQHTRFRHSAIDLGEIEIGEKGFAAVDISSGVRFKAQGDASPPYRAYFVDLESGEEFWWGGAENWEPVPLPPGRYRLDWHEKRFETTRMTLLDEFTVKEDTLVEFGI